MMFITTYVIVQRVLKSIKLMSKAQQQTEAVAAIKHAIELVNRHVNVNKHCCFVFLFKFYRCIPQMNKSK